MRYEMTSKVKALTGSKKRHFYLTFACKISPSTGWSGGSIEYHRLMDYKTGKDMPLHQGNQFNIEAKYQELPTDCILITTGVSMGKPASPVITCRPEQEYEVQKWLGA